MASGKSKIPDDFLIGTGSSAYQIEGAWDADKKAPSIWDTFFHTEKLQETPTLGKQLSPTENDRFYKGIPTFYSETSTTYISGDIACDSYNKIDEDINNLVDLKVNTYRFSVCWPRVLPTCNDQEPNPAGVKYYETLINKLIAKNITPVVTIYHWDLPETLQEIGGWSNPNIIEYFVNYADFLFRTFGSQVKYWTTINEPRILSNGYGMKGMAPISVGDSFNGIADYMAIRNLLLAHAAVYRMYKAKYFAEQRGKISSLCFDTSGYFPINPDLKEDREAVKKAYDFTIGFYAQPLKDGKFPQSVIDGIAETNNIENISLTRLVQFNEKEQEQLRGSYDFIAFNYYESSKVTPMKKTDYNDKTTLKDRDIGVKFDKDITTEEIFKGFTEVVHWFNKEFDKPKIFIAENGYAGTYNVDGTEKKIEYHRGIWTEIENAIKEDKIDIIGYCVWSFMDSLEWSFGYFKYQFGIYKVDFEDPKRPRSKKRSFEFFQNLFESKSLPPIKSYK